MKRLELPIRIPPVTGLHFHAFQLSVVFSYENFIPWFYSHYIQVFGIENPDGVPWYNFVSYNAWENGIPCFLQVHKINRDVVLANNINIVEFVKNYIERGWYTYIGIDDFYIPFRSSYQKNRQPHDIFLYGYDTEKKSFNTAGFNEEEVFSFNQLSFDDFEKAYYYDISNVDKDLFECFDFVTLLKPIKDAKFDFDVTLTKELLNDYIHSIDTTEKLRIVRTPKQNYIYGMKTYLILKKYFQSMLNTGLELDIRPVHLFWEHKKCMLLRIKYMNENGFIKLPGLYNDYMEIEQKALGMRNLMLKYEVSNDSRCIMKIINTLDEIEKKELPLLSNLLEELSSP
ncbi:MAG: hypothetical protein JXB88_00850 [Spirochaetales bacterium]|nr:hypothetical protein [Spirochaetales bacterium]